MVWLSSGNIELIDHAQLLHQLRFDSVSSGIIELIDHAQPLHQLWFDC